MYLDEKIFLLPHNINMNICNLFPQVATQKWVKNQFDPADQWEELGNNLLALNYSNVLVCLSHSFLMSTRRPEPNSEVYHQVSSVNVT